MRDVVGKYVYNMIVYKVEITILLRTGAKFFVLFLRYTELNWKQRITTTYLEVGRACTSLLAAGEFCTRKRADLNCSSANI